MRRDARLQIHLLGPVRVVRDGGEIVLPQSRKMRALLAFLTIEASAKSRSRLCSLLWQIPNDPRSELRWCLSKMRGVLDNDHKSRVLAMADSLISLDLSDCLVDVIEVDRLAKAGIAKASSERLLQARQFFVGDLLDGIQIDSLEFSSWLIAQRLRYRKANSEILRELFQRSQPGSDEAIRCLDEWLQVAPFDLHAHQAMIEALVGLGRIRDAEAHFKKASAAFANEGLDAASLRDVLQTARRLAGSQPASVAIETIEKPPMVSLLNPPVATLVSVPVVTPTSDPKAIPFPTIEPSARPGSLMVMPFGSSAPGSEDVANGLTDDLITRLAKSHALFVVARGTSYALGARGIDSREAGRLVQVNYVLTGNVHRKGQSLLLHIELTKVDGGSILWADDIETPMNKALSTFDAVMNRIVSAIAQQVVKAECKQARVKPPTSLNAWERYHRGLWHMYLFTAPDNAIAADWFGKAIALDPTFARAYAGLSFTHFQNVFLDLTPDRAHEIGLAIETAAHSLTADDHDPAAHWAMGRALWLAGDSDGSIAELERSVELSPSFALGHYTLGFVHAQSGDPRTAISASDHSRQLSPFDPLQFAMLGSRAVAHLRLGEIKNAAEWSQKAIRRPNAHAHIFAIAATSLGLFNQWEQACKLVARIRDKLPGYTVENFIGAFRFPPDMQKTIRKAAKRIGLNG
jgi:DNA-binding SARP family transcriptional activator/TolB-like protein